MGDIRDQRLDAVLLGIDLPCGEDPGRQKAVHFGFDPGQALLGKRTLGKSAIDRTVKHSVKL